MTEDVSRLQSEIETDFNTIKELQDYNAKINVENKNLEAKFEAAHKNAENLNFTVDTLQIENLKNEKEISALQDTTENLQNFNCDLNLRIKNLESSQDTLDSEIKALHDKNHLLSHENTILAQTQNHYTDQIDSNSFHSPKNNQDSIAKILDLEQSLTQVELSKNDAERKFLDSISEFNSLKEELSKTLDENFTLKREICGLKNIKSSQQSDSLDNIEKIKGLDAANGQLRNLLEENSETLQGILMKLELADSSISDRDRKIG